MIRFDDVWKFYGTTCALAGVTFTVAPGEFVFLIGASGSGKTTILRLITRELVAEQGSVIVSGTNVGALSRRRVPQLRRLVSVVPQDFRLLGNRSVHENLQFALQIRGWGRREAAGRIDEVLALVGLDGHADRFPHELSGGERQRAAIARAVAGRPVVLLADEPTGNLDPVASTGIVELLERISTLGTTVLMSTHDHSVVDASGARVLTVDDGVLVTDSPTGRHPVVTVEELD